MTNKQERERIRAARYIPGDDYESVVERTLSTLPSRRRKPAQNRALMGTAVAAALTLFMVFAAPPLVKAASAAIERLFSGMANQIEQRQALPEATRLRQAIEESESYLLTHDIRSSAEFEGVTVTLTNFALHEGGASGAGGMQGVLQATLNWSKIPPFDPNYMNFSAELGGKTYKMELGDGVERYRELGKHALTEDDWANNDFGWFSDSQLVSGVPETYVRMPIPDWKLTENTQITLIGEIDGKSFRLPFLFEPEKAHDQAVQQSKIDMRIIGEMQQERKEGFAELAKIAAPVGLKATVNGKELTISDIAISGNELTLGFSVYPVEAAPNAKLRSTNGTYYLDEILVDGYPCAWAGFTDEEVSDDGTLLIASSRPLIRNPKNLPEQSLICMNAVFMDNDGVQSRVPLAFRYDWRQQRATLPVDADEREAWYQEAIAQAEALVSSAPRQGRIDLLDQNLAQTVGGLTMRVTGVEFYAESVEVRYAFDRGALDDRWRIVDGAEPDPALQISGMDAFPYGGISKEGEPVGSTFILPLHPSEFAQTEACTFDFRALMFDRQDQETYKGDFSFDFTLDMSKLEPYTDDYVALEAE